MNKLLQDLANGDAAFYGNKPNFDDYAIIYQISIHEDMFGKYAQSASALLERAKRREPMNFNVEADMIFTGVMIDAITD